MLKKLEVSTEEHTEGIVGEITCTNSMLSLEGISGVHLVCVLSVL